MLKVLRLSKIPFGIVKNVHESVGWKVKVKAVQEGLELLNVVIKFLLKKLLTLSGDNREVRNYGKRANDDLNGRWESSQSLL